jgi:hypothetical protein
MTVAPADPLGRTVDELREAVYNRISAQSLAMAAAVAEFLETGVMTYDRARELLREFLRLGAEREIAANGRPGPYDPIPVMSRLYLTQVRQFDLT